MDLFLKRFPEDLQNEVFSFFPTCPSCGDKYNQAPYHYSIIKLLVSRREVEIINGREVVTVTLAEDGAYKPFGVYTCGDLCSWVVMYEKLKPATEKLREQLRAKGWELMHREYVGSSPIPVLNLSRPVGLRA